MRAKSSFIGAAPRVRAEAQVLPHRELGERAAALGHVGDAEARDGVGPARAEPLAGEAELAVAPHRARDRAQRRRLAGAVRAEHGRDLALVDGERDAVQRLHRPVAAR